MDSNFRMVWLPFDMPRNSFQHGYIGRLFNDKIFPGQIILLIDIPERIDGVIAEGGDMVRRILIEPEDVTLIDINDLHTSGYEPLFRGIFSASRSNASSL